jgi:hypothetical protein
MPKRFVGDKHSGSMALQRGCFELFREITRHRERSPSWLSTCPRAGLARATTLMFRLRVSWSCDRLEIRCNPLMRDAIGHFKRDSELRPAMQGAPAWPCREERAGAIGWIQGRRLYPTNVLSNSRISGFELRNNYRIVRQAGGARNENIISPLHDFISLPQIIYWMRFQTSSAIPPIDAATDHLMCSSSC